MIKTVANIDGMMCEMCEAHMNNAIRESFKVKKVASSHTKNISVIISDEPIDKEKLKAVVEKLGYTLNSVSSEPYVKKGFSLFGKRK